MRQKFADIDTAVMFNFLHNTVVEKMVLIKDKRGQTTVACYRSLKTVVCPDALPLLAQSRGLSRGMHYGVSALSASTSVE